MDVEIWVHGGKARDLQQVIGFLSGDAHDRSKVRILVKSAPGEYTWFDFPVEPGDNWPVPERDAIQTGQDLAAMDVEMKRWQSELTKGES
jgi:hypothetical protein